MSIAYQPPRSAPVEDMDCPSCKAPIAPRLRVAVESVRAASKRPVTPELLAVCPGCRQLFVLSLVPAPEQAS